MYLEPRVESRSFGEEPRFVILANVVSNYDTDIDIAPFSRVSIRPGAKEPCFLDRVFLLRLADEPAHKIENIGCLQLALSSKKCARLSRHSGGLIPKVAAIFAFERME